MNSQSKQEIQTEMSEYLTDEVKSLITEYIGATEKMGIAVIDKDRRHVYFNDEYREILQLDTDTLYPYAQMESILEKNFDDAQNTSKWVAVAEDNIAVMDNKLNAGVYAHECVEFVTTDGRTLKLNNIYTPNNFMLLTVKDTTDEQRKQKILDLAMEAGRAGYWAYSFETGKFTFSKSVQDRLSDDELNRIDQTGLWAIMETEDLPLVMKQWGEMMSGGDEIDLTYRVTTEMDGTMWQRSVGKVQFTSSGARSSVIAFVTDITADVEKNEALVAAEDSSRAKSDFLARMSHEVKTPLNAIVGLTDSLRDDDLNSDVRSTIELIEQSAEDLNQLLSQALDHTRIMSENLQVDLHPESPIEIIREIEGLWRPKCSLKGLGFNIDIDDNISAFVPLDRYRVQQCLNNLMSNALKFTAGGYISLSLKQLEQDNKKNLVFIVKDTGVGMTEAQCKTAFQPFEQADTSITRSYGGTGLGLSVAQQLVKLMGGHISVRSVPDQGTAFAIGIPVKIRSESDTSAKKTPDTLETNLNNNSDAPTDLVDAVLKESDIVNSDMMEGLSILCVEDNPINQHVVKKLIGKQVAKLSFANNGQEALDQLDKIHFDIILMDIHMPVMDGIEATIEIRNSNAEWADVIIIALTADADYQQARICRNLGMNGTIGKPVKRKEIVEVFERALSEMSQSMGRKVKLSA